MTTEVTQANEENVFEAPQADLGVHSGNKPILEFKRFSAWGVFLLGIVTLGLYYIYWVYNRSQKTNALSQNKKASLISIYIVIACLIGLISLPFVFVDQQTIANAEGIINLVYFIAWIVAIFSLRSAIAEIINMSGEDAEPVYLNGILTFFFSAIYIQYKINEAIDNQS
ncbi:DUF4234 domain-containing protein [Thalassotalea sp. PS06]|uniref:DUF4234 domain-containing protein n=1 Tax=Thalassotalea sp. PS06 TaxID=2594005 RepID=UPI00116455AD|nr:DUF4234 domain-containing protein [Thalassotalea sp. PS06]QDP02315.1 DUF4234 domain-containing protein [Thalassotalea sp. PS06]